MAFPYSERQSVAVDRIVEEVTNQKFTLNKAFEIMKKKGIVTEWGPNLRVPIIAGTSGNAQKYQGFEPLSFLPSVNVRAAQYAWYNRHDALAISGDEWRETSGEQGKVNLVKTKAQIMTRSIMDQLGTDMFSNNDGTSFQPLGWQKIGAASTAIGGFAPADLTEWDANRDTTTGAPTLARATTLIRKSIIRGARTEMMACFTRASVMNKFDAGLLGTNVLRVVDKKNIAFGFSDVSLLGVPIIMDDHVPGSDGGTNDNYMIFVDFDGYTYYTHRDQNFLVSDPTKAAYQQDSILRRIGVTSQFAINSRWTQSLFTAIDPA